MSFMSCEGYFFPFFGSEFSLLSCLELLQELITFGVISEGTSSSLEGLLVAALCKKYVPKIQCFAQFVYIGMNSTMVWNAPENISVVAPLSPKEPLVLNRKEPRLERATWITEHIQKHSVPKIWLIGPFLEPSFQVPIYLKNHPGLDSSIAVSPCQLPHPPHHVKWVSWSLCFWKWQLSLGGPLNASRYHADWLENHNIIGRIGCGAKWTKENKNSPEHNFPWAHTVPNMIFAKDNVHPYWLLLIY